jgi:hypothetical protein
MSRYCITSQCQDCICRRIIETTEIVAVLSDEHNRIDERRRLMELLSERRRMKEELEMMGRV